MTGVEQQQQGVVAIADTVADLVVGGVGCEGDVAGEEGGLVAGKGGEVDVRTRRQHQVLTQRAQQLVHKPL